MLPVIAYIDADVHHLSLKQIKNLTYFYRVLFHLILIKIFLHQYDEIVIKRPWHPLKGMDYAHTSVSHEGWSSSICVCMMHKCNLIVLFPKICAFRNVNMHYARFLYIFYSFFFLNNLLNKYGKLISQISWDDCLFLQSAIHPCFRKSALNSYSKSSKH